MAYTRYALYYTPPPGALADFGMNWLGWDSARGVPCPQHELTLIPADLRETVAQSLARPRRYGFHATVKPPFALAAGMSETALLEAVARHACQQGAVSLPLRLALMGRFFALMPDGDTTAITRLAAEWVTQLDRFRAPPSKKELERRQAGRKLTQAQERNLIRWGYPHVMDTFRFHITLTGRLPKSTLDDIEPALQARLAPMLTDLVAINQISVVGEAENGNFHRIAAFWLGGPIQA